MDEKKLPVHLLVVGGGAIGAFYGSRMHQPSNNVFVSVVCRSNYHEVSASGFTMDTKDWSKYTFRPHRVFASVQDAASSGIVWDHVVVTTKALPDIMDTADVIEPVVTVGKSAVHLLQNGIGVEEGVWRRFGGKVDISSA
ncbi:hypothetical protein HK104_005601, partial [Borealophlyctis nickersoniae]